jgi:hypothetical protein
VVSRRAGPFSYNKRGLCRECFWGHHLTIGNHSRQKRQQNPNLAGRPYPAFWLPNNC